MAKTSTTKKPAAASKKAGGTSAAKSAAKTSAKSSGKAVESVEVDGDEGAGAGGGGSGGGAKGKKLVIVESPAKAKTINKYLGSDYLVKASVGHVRDLPSKNPKGVKAPVPGVDLERRFAPTYEVLPGKEKTMNELKRAAKVASEIWFATDLDREGEAIAWHLAQELGIRPEQAKRVMFNAITRDEIKRAFSNPHPIDQSRVDAQQARRILDRIVGYQVSPLLWKKVARGLSAGRVQSVAVRLVVDREREIRAFVPDEHWVIEGRFTLSEGEAAKLGPAWRALLEKRDEKGNPPTVKTQNAWLAERKAISAELVEVAGEAFEISNAGGAAFKEADLSKRVIEVATRAGLINIKSSLKEDPEGKGPAKHVRTVTGDADVKTPYVIRSIETKRTKSRPGAPFITSTLQQAASSRLGFGAQRTMRTAQRLYEGVEVPGEGAVGLITYMRTDSTHLSGDALNMARTFIAQTYGEKYLPEKPNFFGSTNKAAQEAHEAIRPTSMAYPPERVQKSLEPDQFKLYKLIWERFVSCQMVAAEWDSTSVLIDGGVDARKLLTFRATGRVLAFDGFYRCSGVPTASDEQTLPAVKEGQKVSPFAIEPEQKFGSPPPRFTEASLIKKLEEEGIGRPSTYASIVSVIQERKYVELNERRFFATDLGEVVTDKLIEAFPDIMDVGYTRDMELELDHIEDERKDWVDVLDHFYKPFKGRLEWAHEELGHAKAELVPAPKEYRCKKCGSDTVYRFGKNGRFLSCATYPACDFASPVDKDGKPRPVEDSGVACHKCGRPMLKRTGRFGAFLGCSGYGVKPPEVACDGILKLDKHDRVVAPAVPPLETELECEKCKSKLYLRNGLKGPWLSCSAFPKCRGRGKWAAIPEPEQKKLLKMLEEHEKAHPIPIIRSTGGAVLTDAKGKPLVKVEGTGFDPRGGPGGAGAGEASEAEEMVGVGEE
ncbi:MAG: DNA topoisomerase [Phycisphaerales bacterium]